MDWNSNMKTCLTMLLLVFAAVVISPSALAEEEDDGSEDTMVVIEAGATPEDIVNIIELPFAASANAADHSASGLDVAAVNTREPSLDFGEQMAEEARSIGEQIRDDLQQKVRRDARADNGRGHQ